jgi:hypothetical protein
MEVSSGATTSLGPSTTLPSSHGQVPTLLRQTSVTSDYGWEQDLTVLACDCISLETFIGTLRNSASIMLDLPDNFLTQFFHSSGILLVWVKCLVEAKQEGNKQRKMFAYIKSGSTGTFADRGTDVRVRVVEARDEHVNEATMNLRNGTVQCHSQVVHNSKSKFSGKSEGAGMEVFSFKFAQQRAGEEATKSSLQRARDMEYPVRSLCIDPQWCVYVLLCCVVLSPLCLRVCVRVC